MAAFNKNRVLRGTDGRVFFEGELMGNVKSFEAKVSVNKDSILANGDYGEKHIMNSYSIAGTFTGFKCNSYILKKYAEALKTGVMPELTVVGQNADRGAGTVERVAMYGVIPDEIMLTKFENGTIVEEEMPFTADDYKVLDTL